MSDELKACECGESPLAYQYYGGETRAILGWQVSCDCGRRGPWHQSCADAIAAWNRRVVTREQVERMALEIRGWIIDPRHRAYDASQDMLRAAGFEVAE